MNVLSQIEILNFNEINIYLVNNQNHLNNFIDLPFVKTLFRITYLERSTLFEMYLDLNDDITNYKFIIDNSFFKISEFNYWHLKIKKINLHIIDQNQITLSIKTFHNPNILFR